MAEYRTGKSGTIYFTWEFGGRLYAEHYVHPIIFDPRWIVNDVSISARAAGCSFNAFSSWRKEGGSTYRRWNLALTWSFAGTTLSAGTVYVEKELGSIPGIGTPNIWDLDLSGAGTISVPYEVCISYSEQNRWPSYGGTAIPDPPKESDLVIFYRTIAGSAGMCVANFTCGSVSISGTLIPSSAISISPSFHSGGGAESFDRDLDLWTTEIITGTVGRMSCVGSCSRGGVSGSVEEWSDNNRWYRIGRGEFSGSAKWSAGGYMVSGDCESWVDKVYDLSAVVRAMGDTYPTDVSLRFDRNALEGSVLLNAPSGLYSEAGTQVRFYQIAERWHYDSSLSDWVLDGSGTAGRDEQAAQRIWVDAFWLSTNGEDVGQWRMLFRGPYFDAISLFQRGTTIFTTTPGTAGGTVTFSLPSARFASYRYLHVPTDTPNAPVTVDIGVKRWNVSTGEGGTIVVDLMSPHNAAVSVDRRDSRWQSDNTNTITGAGCLYGVHNVGTITFSNMQGGTTYNFSGTLFLQAHSPGRSNFMGAYRMNVNDRSRFLWGDTDGKTSMEEIHFIPSSDLSGIRLISQLVADISAVDAGVKRNPGWEVAYLGSTDAPNDTSGTAMMAGGLLNKNRPACWLYGNGLGYWSGNWQSGLDVTGTVIVGQLLSDSVDFAAGVGDVFDLSTASPVGAYPLRAACILRGGAHGLVVGADSAPAGGVEVVMQTLFTPSFRGSGTTDAIGYYKTGLPYGIGQVPHTLTAHIGDVWPLGTTPYFHARKVQRISFRGTAVSAGFVELDEYPFWRHVMIRSDSSGSVLFAVSPDVKGYAWEERPMGIQGTVLDVVVDDWSVDGHIVFTTLYGGTVSVWRISGEGESIQMSQVIATGASYNTFTIGFGGLQYHYWVAGSAIRGKILDSGGGTVVDEFVVVSSGVDNASIAVSRPYTLVGGTQMINLAYHSGGNLVLTRSSDGIYFL